MLEADLQRQGLEKDGVFQRITDLIHENATTKMDQGEYNCRYDALEAQRIAISEKQKRIKEKLSDKLFQKRKLEAFMCELKTLNSWYPLMNSCSFGQWNRSRYFPTSWCSCSRTARKYLLRNNQ